MILYFWNLAWHKVVNRCILAYNREPSMRCLLPRHCKSGNQTSYFTGTLLYTQHQTNEKVTERRPLPTPPLQPPSGPINRPIRTRKLHHPPKPLHHSPNPLRVPLPIGRPSPLLRPRPRGRTSLPPGPRAQRSRPGGSYAGRY